MGRKVETDVGVMKRETRQLDADSEREIRDTSNIILVIGQ